MGKWSDLTAQQKAAVIKFAMDNGVSDINSIRDTYNLYSASTWTSEMENRDYDMAAAKATGIKADYRGHYPDTFKKPNHVTFSTESMYSDPIVKGGTWGDNYTSFTPSEFQKRNWTREEMLEALKNQGDSNVTLNYGEGGGIHIKHPGRLTALKKRTGKTEAELWATGNAHTRKMITFARNARKWHKHDQESTESLSDPNNGNLNLALSDNQFIPNDNIKNVQVWLNKGTRFQKQREGTVNLQNITDKLDPFGPDNQYIWDDAEHNSYSAFRRNPNYRAPMVSASKGNVPNGIFVPSIHIPTDISNRVKTLYTNTAIHPRVAPATPQLNDWIDDYTETNGAYGATIMRSKSRPEYFAIKYWTVPGTINGGQGSFAQTDSVKPMLSIDEVNALLFDYKNKVGNVGFNRIDHYNSTGGPLYPFSFSGYIPAVRYDEGGSVRNWDTTLTGKLINYVENSDSIGWNPTDRTWEHPIIPGYDKNQIGMGVDRNKTPGYWDSIQTRPKTRTPFLAELDERAIRHNAIEAANTSANARYRYAQTAVNRPKGTISPIKDAAVVSAIYNLGVGNVANGLFEDKAFMLKLFDGTDKEVVDRINQEYKKKNRNERIAKTNAFLFTK